MSSEVQEVEAAAPRPDGSQKSDDVPTGPRGGTTTVTDSGMVKKNLWVPAEMAERLRKVAYEERTSEAEIMRQGLALALEERK